MIQLPEAKKERLAALLFQRSYESRQVTLASGKQSDFYLDCKQTTLHPEGLYLAGRFFLDAIRSGDGKNGKGVSGLLQADNWQAAGVGRHRRGKSQTCNRPNGSLFSSIISQLNDPTLR